MTTSVSFETMQAELARLKEENETLKKGSVVTLKVSTKGGISIYGLQRFPVTLYKGQWAKVFQMQDEINSFIETNLDSLEDK